MFELIVDSRGIDPSQTLDTPGGQLRFEDKFTCATSNLIYVLSCRKCSKLYIRETGRRLGDRFREHIRSVGANTDLPVGKHFSSPGHSLGDMLVSVICAGFRTTMVRRSMEARLIFRHKTLQPNGMNIDLHFSDCYFLARARVVDTFLIFKINRRALLLNGIISH